MATIKKVATIKASLSKKVSNMDSSLSDEDVESCKDMLQSLEGMDITLDILTKTLIGTVVSKLKNHDALGPMAKALVKKWKKVAKGEATGVASTAASAAAAAAKTERRNSTNSATDELQNEWASLQPHRQNTCQKLHDFLKLAKPALIKDGINSGAVDHLVVERATDIEAAIQEKHRNDKTEYLGKARSLCFNIKKNMPLASQIVLGHIEAADLVSMTSEQLASDEKRKEMEERTKKLMESKQLDWEAQNEDKINEMCGIKGELLKASLFTW
jgi:transcription elongation factor S-II